MKRFKKILAFVNGPESIVALKRAMKLAEENEAQLLAFDVLRPPSAVFEAFTGSDFAEGLRKDIVRQREQELATLVAERASDRLTATSKVCVGTPYIEIIREVLQNGHDLVVKTAEGQSLLRQRIFGGTALQLMRQCPCPVWIVKSEHDRQLKRILAAVDVEVDADLKQHSLLNNNILKIATSLAEIEGAELHVVHVWSLWAESILKSRLPENEFQQMLTEHKDATAAAMNRLLEPFDIEADSPNVRLIRGVPELVIPQLVQAEQIELLVMGTVCRTGIPGLMIGNTAEHVLSDVDCSVLTLKPDGFQSPVTLSD